LSLEAGMDMEFPMPQAYGQGFCEAVEQENVDVEYLINNRLKYRIIHY